jgi:hypothetical protein
MDYIFSEMDFSNIEFKEKEEGCDLPGSEGSVASAVPGKPSAFFH